MILDSILDQFEFIIESGHQGVGFLGLSARVDGEGVERRREAIALILEVGSVTDRCRRSRRRAR